MEARAERSGYHRYLTCAAIQYCIAKHRGFRLCSDLVTIRREGLTAGSRFFYEP